MAKVNLPYLDQYTDRHGKARCYYRRNGLRLALPLPGDAAFLKAYDEASARFARSPEIASEAARAGTWDALVIAYYRSPDFVTLRASTKVTYRGIIDRWRSEHGAKRVTHLLRRHVQEHIAASMEASGPHAANNLRQMLKALCRFALDNDWRRDDPTVGVRPVRAKSDGFVSWSEDDIAAFEKRWPVGTRERLALALLLYTGQRRGDVVRMGRQHVGTAVLKRGEPAQKIIRVVQGKTGVSLMIPLHAALREAIDETPSDNLTFLMTTWGKPFTAAGFGNWFRNTCDAAGLQGRSAHGLRKAAARRLAEAGATALQIGSITGHKTLKEVSRYTAAADQAHMASDAVDKLSR
jgi:integrase